MPVRFERFFKVAKTPKSPKETPEDVITDAVIVEDAVEAAAVDETSDDVKDEVVTDEPTDQPKDEIADDTTESAAQAAVDEDGDASGPATTPAPVIVKRGGFVPLVLGGVIAAVVGFGAARYVVPDGWPFPGVTPDEDPVAMAVQANEARLTALETSNTSVAAAVTALKDDTSVDTLRGEMSGEFTALVARLETMTTRIDEIEVRLLTVEKLPTGAGAEAAVSAAAAYERELAEMRAMLERELARISTVQEDAQVLEVSAAEAAKAAAGRAALSRILAAVDTGRPFDDAVFDLSKATGLAVPAALVDLAQDGVPTLAALQEDFPTAARASLDASIRAAVEDGSMDRMTAFLRTQLGVRSLEAKEGDDPDAILSRAEAALRNGDIAGALAELTSMPEPGQPALADWISTAKARADAIAAGEALAVQVNEN